MGGDPEQGSCSDGMPEELTTELARLAGVSIIALNSGFTDKGKPVKPDQVNRAPGVRVTPEEAEHRGGLSMKEAAEGKFDEGIKFYGNNNKDDNARARERFGEVLNAKELDPRLAARAYAGLAATYRQDWNFGWTTDDPTTLEQQAFEKAKKSVEVDPSSPYGHVQLAYLHLYRMEHDQAEKEARKAVRLGGDSFADGYAVLAQVLTYAGEPQIAVALMEKALALEKEAPVYYHRHLGQAYYVMGQDEKYQKKNAEKAKEYYQKAEESLKEARNHRPARLTLAAVYMETYQEREARALFAGSPDMRPHISISRRRQQAPYKDRVMRDRYIDALRRAGSSMVEVYGADGHEDTARTRWYLDSLGIAYQYINVEQNQQAPEWVKQQNDGKERKPLVKIRSQVLAAPSDPELEQALQGERLLP
jgi:tetratricopeptide (TPR) repeat protein